MPQTRLDAKRASRASRRKRNEASASAPSGKLAKYRDVIITTLLTLLITGLFGDFVIKRNIEGYKKERAAFDAAVAEADKAFEEARDFFNSRLKDRRSASQQIIKYIKDNDIASFNAAYPEYARTVGAWNDDHSAMAQIILETTQCEEKFEGADPEYRMAAFAEAFDLHSNLDAHRPFLDVFPNAPAEAHEAFLGASRFCPTHFLTRNGEHSVHRQFRTIHRNIYNYLVHNYSECRLRHIRNLGDYYKACANKIGFEPVGACMARYDQMVNEGAFCGAHDFDLEEYKVRDIEFNALDFWWGLGNSFFVGFREDFMLRECRKKIAFWGDLLGWDCEKAVADYLTR